LIQRRFPGLRPVGFDISDSACAAYRRVTGGEAIQGDLTRPLQHHRRFDAALAIGGLHHCIVNLPQAIDNLAQLVKPGGVLLMMEPSSDGVVERLRNRWYRHDHYFDAQTEHALSHDELLQLTKGQFRAEVVRYIGGPAYFLILNSLILRVPLGAKRMVAAGTWPLERAFNALNSRGAAAAFIARWRRV